MHLEKLTPGETEHSTVLDALTDYLYRIHKDPKSPNTWSSPRAQRIITAFTDYEKTGDAKAFEEALRKKNDDAMKIDIKALRAVTALAEEKARVNPFDAAIEANVQDVLRAFRTRAYQAANKGQHEAEVMAWRPEDPVLHRVAEAVKARLLAETPEGETPLELKTQTLPTEGNLKIARYLIARW